MISISDLTKKYGGKTVLENLSLDFPAYGRVYITGASGSGKTTLIRCILGLEQYSGTISFPEKTAFSVSFQEPRLFPWLSCEDNIKAVGVGGISVGDALDTVMLTGTEKLFPSELSGGMKQRLSIARAIYHGGDVFIFDEPFSAIDEKTKAEIRNHVFNLLRDKLVIIVSHDEQEIKEFADRIITL